MDFAGGTIAAKGTLALARVVGRSFAQHHPGIPFYVLLADEVDGFFDPAQEPYELLLLRDLDLPEPARVRFALSQQPLSYALTPYLIGKLLESHDRVMFIKQESLVLGDLTSPVAALPAGGIALTPHILDPLEGFDAYERELNILLSGVFNAGFVGVAAGDAARRVLSWWESRVYTHCRHAVGEGMHYEQRWLDLAPAYFDNIHIVRDPAMNVGHWNLRERQGSCRLFRASGFQVERPQEATRYSPGLRVSDLGAAGGLFERYRDALLAEGQRETATWPYAYGHFDNGVEIPDIARHIYAERDDVERFGNPFATDSSSYYRWLTQPAEPPGGPSRLWYEIHGLRADLQTAFADPLGRDRRAFLRWVRSAGVGEYQIPAALR